MATQTSDESPREPKQLVVVPGHGVCTGQDAYDDSAWVGINASEGRFLVEHIKAGVETAARTGAILVFSGGMTRPAAGRISEAGSYFGIAEREGWFGHPEVRGRALLEEYARDSFENVAFSCLRFYRETGAFPEKVTVCGWKFKKERLQFHAKTLGMLPEQFGYLGVNDHPGGFTDEIALGDFMKDPTGGSGKLLQKKLGRDPFKRGGIENYAGELEAARALGYFKALDTGGASR